MTIEELQHICQSLSGTEQDIKWEDHLCFTVGGKIYLITSPDHFPVTASFKVSEEDFHALTEREGIFPARYLARYSWVQVDDINRLNREDWEVLIRQSYQLVFQKLPARVRKEVNE